MRKRRRTAVMVAMTLLLGCLLGATPAYANVGDDTMEDARTISVNATYSGKTVAYADPDWYRFGLAEDGPVQIVFENDQHSRGS